MHDIIYTMKFKHSFLIILVILAVGYTTIDRLNDAGEVVSAQQAQYENMSNNSCHGGAFCTHDELFCDFPMIAKASFTLTDLSGSTPATITNTYSKPALYSQERFRPPAYTVV